MKKIFIVDDDAIITKVYRDMFEIEGYAVDSAADGEIAMDKLKSMRPDLVLLDLFLPKIPGIVILRHIRGEESTKTVPVIVFSNAYLAKMVEAAWKAGASSCLTKSDCTPEQLLETVQAAIGPGEPPPAPPPAAESPTPPATPEARTKAPDPAPPVAPASASAKPATPAAPSTAPAPAPPAPPPRTPAIPEPPAAVPPKPPAQSLPAATPSNEQPAPLPSPAPQFQTAAPTAPAPTLQHAPTPLRTAAPPAPTPLAPSPFSVADGSATPNPARNMYPEPPPPFPPEPPPQGYPPNQPQQQMPGQPQFGQSMMPPGYQQGYPQQQGMPGMPQQMQGMQSQVSRSKQVIHNLLRDSHRDKDPWRPDQAMEGCSLSNPPWDTPHNRAACPCSSTVTVSPAKACRSKCRVLSMDFQGLRSVMDNPFSPCSQPNNRWATASKRQCKATHSLSNPKASDREATDNALACSRDFSPAAHLAWSRRSVPTAAVPWRSRPSCARASSAPPRNS